MIDKSSGRPIDANNFFKTEYYNSDRAALDIFPEKINPVKTTECSDIRQVYYSDIDINNHVNAGKYISWIQDLFPVEHYLENQIGMLQINYLSETRIGEKVQLFSESEDTDQKNFRIEGRIENTQAPAFRARIEWGKINN